MRLMKEIKLQSTESSSDFMKQPLECENKVPFSVQKQYLDLFENAAVIELGGLCASDASYWAVKHNLLLVVDCGCWD